MQTSLGQRTTVTDESTPAELYGSLSTDLSVLRGGQHALVVDHG